MRCGGPAMRFGTIGRAEIVQGWALVYFTSRPVALLGKGDQITYQFLCTPFEIVEIEKLDIREVPAADATGLPCQIIGQLARHSARLSVQALVRVSDLLCEAAKKWGRDDQGKITFNLPLSQTQLAELLGMSAVHMNRTLQELKRRGLLDTTKGRFAVRDISSLADIASARHL